jgi:hypothetical protein
MSLYLQLQESGVTPISLCPETCDTCDLPMYASTSMELQISKNMDIGEWIGSDEKPYTFKKNDIQKMEAVEFLCPISATIMCDPVAMSDGYTYDYEHIVKLFTEKLNGVESPVTKEVFIAKAYPAFQLRSLIEKWAASLDSPAFRSNTDIVLDKPPSNPLKPPKPPGTPPPPRPPASTNPSVVPPPPLPPASIPPGNPGPSLPPFKKNSIPTVLPPTPFNNGLTSPRLLEFAAYKKLIPYPMDGDYRNHRVISFFNNDIAIAVENFSKSKFIGSKVYMFRMNAKNVMKRVLNVDVTGLIRGMAFSPSGLLYVADNSNNVYVVQNSSILKRILQLDDPSGLGFTTDGLLVVKYGGHVISFVENQVVGKVSGDQNGGIACMCTYKNLIMVQFQNGILECYTSRGVLFRRAGTTLQGVKSVMYTPSGKFITVSANQIDVWSSICNLEWTLKTTGVVPSDCISIRPYTANGTNVKNQVFIAYLTGFYELVNPKP